MVNAVLGGTNFPSEGSSTMQSLSPTEPKRGMQVLRVLTYNVHSCRGTDRRHDPPRIAEVIAACNPDIIALQELDVGRVRTGGIDQANVIADHLRMQAHFHPTLHVEEEKYGDAILTALPSRLVRAAALPSIGEPRGAIWIEIDVAGRKLQVINTHFGLRRRERTNQASALLGPDWLGHDRCRSNPALLVGDFNAVPSSPVYGLLARQLTTVLPESRRRLKPTFPTRLPLLRLDHVFGNDRVEAMALDVVDTPLARRASDHLPLLATVRFAAQADQIETWPEPMTASRRFP
jgi:endonuclease/exonuclease/phosphatase family metal-dependent hydrolase